MDSFDRDDAIPLYLQVGKYLRNEILKGTYTGMLPSEHELVELFKVSRATIRRAIRKLSEEGVLETRQGIGSFITIRPVEEWLGHLSTYFDIVNEMGMKPNIKLLCYGIVKTPQDALKIFDTKHVYQTMRLRSANDIPIVIERQYYPLEIGQKLLKYDLNNISTYEILENDMGITLWEAKQTISAVIPTSEEKKLLNLHGSTQCCALLSKRLVVDIQEHPCEYEKSIYRADMYKFCINLTRKRKK